MKNAEGKGVVACVGYQNEAKSIPSADILCYLTLSTCTSFYGFQQIGCRKQISAECAKFWTKTLISPPFYVPEQNNLLAKYFNLLAIPYTDSGP